MKKTIALVSSILISSSLYADPSQGAYVGLGLGSSIFNDGGYSDDLKTYAINNGSTITITDDYSSQGLKLYAGYQINRVVGVEVSYIDYGTHTLKASTSTMELNPTSIGIAANVGYSIGENAEYRPFAILGVSSVNMNENGTIKAYDDSSTTAFKFGVGFEYYPVKLAGFGFRVAYEGDFYTVKDTNPSNIPELKDSYSNSLSMFYIGASYKF